MTISPGLNTCYHFLTALGHRVSGVLVTAKEGFFIFQQLSVINKHLYTTIPVQSLHDDLKVSTCVFNLLPSLTLRV